MASQHLDTKWKISGQFFILSTYPSGVDGLAADLERSNSRRGAMRANVFLAATLLGEHSQFPVTVRNLSSTGALIQSRSMIKEDNRITLVRGGLHATGTVVWKEGHLGGISFAEPINPSLWIPGAAYQGQVTVDKMIAECRGQKIPAVASKEQFSASAKTSGSNLIDRIAEEMAAVVRRLDSLGDDLSNDPITVARHAGRLQDLDIAGQVLGHLTRLLTTADPDALLKTIGMADLRRRLERTSLE